VAFLDTLAFYAAVLYLLCKRFPALRLAFEAWLWGPHPPQFKEKPMGGYANRVMTIDFPELSDPDDQETGRVFVVLRNPKTVTLSKLEVAAVAQNPDGTPDADEASKAIYGLLSRLVIGGRLYDAEVDGIDADGAPLDQPELTYPLTEETAAKLPIEVITAITERIREAQTPR
jgi:hypothetical protein